MCYKQKPETKVLLILEKSWWWSPLSSVFITFACEEHDREPSHLESTYPKLKAGMITNCSRITSNPSSPPWWGSVFHPTLESARQLRSGRKLKQFSNCHIHFFNFKIISYFHLCFFRYMFLVGRRARLYMILSVRVSNSSAVQKQFPSLGEHLILIWIHIQK